MKSLMPILVLFMILGFAAKAQNNDVSNKNALAVNDKVKVSNLGDIFEIKPIKLKDKTGSVKLVKNESTYTTHKQFLSDFGKFKITKWKSTNRLEVITFINKEGAEVSAYYDKDAQLIGTTTPKTFENLPDNAQTTINKKYADYRIVDIIFYDYTLQFSDSDNYFVQLEKENAKRIILKVNQNGRVNFYKSVK